MSDHSPTRPHETLGQIMLRLKEGNVRFAKGHTLLADSSPRRRSSLVAGQNPAVAVLACSDSRVSPEIIFDQGLGELFVVRVAGNVVDDTVLGSIEYAVEHLGVSVVAVVGHTKCGAVTSACSCSLDDIQGATGALLKAIGPSVAEARSLCSLPGDLVDVCGRINVATQAKALLASPVVHDAVNEGYLTIVSGWYDLDTGLISWL